MSLKSRLVPTCSPSGCVKLGQPVPLSHFASPLKSGKWHAAQMYVPRRFSRFRGLELGGSVPSSNRTWYRSADSAARQTARDLFSFSTGSDIPRLLPGSAAPLQQRRRAALTGRLVGVVCGVKAGGRSTRDRRGALTPPGTAPARRFGRFSV